MTPPREAAPTPRAGPSEKAIQAMLNAWYAGTTPHEYGGQVYVAGLRALSAAYDAEGYDPEARHRPVLTVEQADAIEAEIRRAEADPAIDKHALRMLMQSTMPCGHAYGELMTCDSPPFGCAACLAATDPEALARLMAALELAATRLEILTDRMRGCHEITGRHELLSEAEAFCTEARAALAGTP